MVKFGRNALRLSLAGAGVAVLGAGFVGPASADEHSPEAESSSQAQGTSQVAGATPSASESLPAANTMTAGPTSPEDLLSLAEPDNLQNPGGKILDLIPATS